MLRRVLLSASVGVLVVGLVPKAGAEGSVPQSFQRAGFNSLISVASDGTQADATAADADISPDGRFVTFFSDSTTLVPGDTGAWGDVFLRDRIAGTTERISSAPDGTEADQMSMQAAVNADGRYVAFLSYATNISGETGLPVRVAEVYVRDRVNNTITRVTKGLDGGPSSAGALAPEITEDGRYVTFHSASDNLVPGDTNAKADIFLYDQVDGTMARITDGNGSSLNPTFSPGGRYIGFISGATNLAEGDDNAVNDVYLYDRDTQGFELISVSSEEAAANDLSNALSAVSADGRYVAFQSQAFNLVPNDTNNLIPSAGGDIFVRDRELGTTERVSLRPNGMEFVDCTSLSMTPEGRYVAFSCIKDDSDPADFLAPADIWLRDRETGATELISARPSNVPADGESENPRLTADGRYVFFQTDGGEFVPSDANEVVDVVMRDRVTNFGTFGMKLKGIGANRSLTGNAVYPGVVLAQAADAPADALGATQLGSEITGASLVYRRDTADLLLRIPITEMPSFADTVPFVGAGIQHGGAPGIVHGVRFTLGAQNFEVRAMRAAATQGSIEPYFARYICTTTCGGPVPLEGGYGTTGNEIVISITTANLALQPGETLENIEVFSALGESATSIESYDSVALGDVTLPDTTIRFGSADPAADESSVLFDLDMTGTGGAFDQLLSNLQWEGRALWTRACIGDVCSGGSKLN